MFVKQLVTPIIEEYVILVISTKMLPLHFIFDLPVLRSIDKEERISATISRMNRLVAK